jgi:hypothetical protein
LLISLLIYLLIYFLISIYFIIYFVLYNNNDFDFYKRGLAPFGAGAAIDKNTIQYAFFSEINCTGSFAIAMPERSNVYLKYLIDASGSLVELTQRDYTNIKNNRLPLHSK